MDVLCAFGVAVLCACVGWFGPRFSQTNLLDINTTISKMAGDVGFQTNPQAQGWDHERESSGRGSQISHPDLQQDWRQVSQLDYPPRYTGTGPERGRSRLNPMPATSQLGLAPGFHNFPDYPLSDVETILSHFQKPEFPQAFDQSGAFRPSLLALFSSQGASMRNPLRCVVRRDIEKVRVDWGRTVTIYHEVLDCGHPYSLIPVLEEEMIAKRRRCAACAAVASLPLKKDVQQVVIELPVKEYKA